MEISKKSKVDNLSKKFKISSRSLSVTSSKSRELFTIIVIIIILY